MWLVIYQVIDSKKASDREVLLNELGRYLIPLVKTVAFCAAITLAMLSVAPNSAATSLKPKIAWDCQLMRLQDDQGTFVYFDPRAKIQWYGRSLRYEMLYWSTRDTRKSQAGRIYGKVTGGTGGRNLTSLDLSHDFRFGYDSEYKKVSLAVTDNAGRTSRTVCVWDGPVANGW